MGTPANVIAGPGLLYVALHADVVDSYPTDASTPLGASWAAVGFTLEGSEFDWTVTREDMFVAEQNPAIRSYATKEEGMLKAVLAEATAANLRLVLNNYDPTAVSGAAVSPPSSGEEVAVAFVLDGEQGQRVLYKKCRNSGSITIGRKKAPTATGLPLSAKLETPDDGSAPWVAFPSALDLI